MYQTAPPRITLSNETVTPTNVDYLENLMHTNADDTHNIRTNNGELSGVTPSTSVHSDGLNTTKVALNIATIKPDMPINIYTWFCLNTAKSKFSLVSPVTD